MKEQFFGREEGWLGFNGRILDEAADPSVPLLERFRFLSICSSNQDEFYRVPVIHALNALKERNRLNHKEKAEATADLPAVRTMIDHRQNKFGAILCDGLIPALGSLGTNFLDCSPFPDKIPEAVNETFFDKVLAYLQPAPLL